MIEFLSVSKWYGQVSALTDVSFSIEEGVVGLVGQNGAGKSTIIKLISGLLRPSLGQVELDQGDPRIPANRARLGYCPDIDNFHEDLSGAEFVTWMMRLQGYPGREARQRARDTLDRLGLSDAMDRAIRGYSKGMRQRVKLAQALAHQPHTILLDEPMTGLDPVARHEMGDAIRRMGEAGVCVLVSSHVLHELESLAQHILLIHRGRLLAEGKINELRQQLEDRPHKIRLRSASPRALAAKVAAIGVVRGIEVREKGVDISTGGGEGLFAELSRIGGEADGLVDEIIPLDDKLESVFGYLVN